MSKLMKLLTGQTGKSENELTRFVEKFGELADLGGKLGINFKALVDEDTGAVIEPGDLAQALGEQIIALMTDANIEVPDEMPETIMELVQATITDAVGMAEDETEMAEEMRAWVEKSVELVDNVMDIGDDITTLTDSVVALTEKITGVEASQKAVASDMATVKRQLRARKPASQATETEISVDDLPADLIDQIKEMLAEQNNGQQSSIVPPGYYKG